MFESSSKKSNASEPRLLFDGELSGIGGPDAKLEIRGTDGSSLGDGRTGLKAETPAEAARQILDAVCESSILEVEAVGYRVVHPGAKLNEHQRITADLLSDLEEAVVFAPLHDPAGIAVIREGMRRFPSVAHYACFDTVFHQTMPDEATTYPVPLAYRENGVRRYGFHGLSCESIIWQMRGMFAKGTQLPKRMVIGHLGSGCSVTALVDGCSVDTTMGLTPTGGVVMGTRPGDLDPGLVLYLLRQQAGDRDHAISTVETMFNHESGMVALTGMPNDMKAVRKAAIEGDERAAFSLKVFTRSVTKAIGGFSWLLGGVDAIVFTGGIGEHDAVTRAQVLGDLQSLGVAIDSSLNDANEHGVRRISASESQTVVFVVPAQEDLMIAVHVDRMAQSGK